MKPKNNTKTFSIEITSLMFCIKCKNKIAIKINMQNKKITCWKFLAFNDIVYTVKYQKSLKPNLNACTLKVS